MLLYCLIGDIAQLAIWRGVVRGEIKIEYTAVWEYSRWKVQAFWQASLKVHPFLSFYKEQQP